MITKIYLNYKKIYLKRKTLIILVYFEYNIYYNISNIIKSVNDDTFLIFIFQK